MQTLYSTSNSNSANISSSSTSNRPHVGITHGARAASKLPSLKKALDGAGTSGAADGSPFADGRMDGIQSLLDSKVALKQGQVSGESAQIDPSQKLKPMVMVSVVTGSEVLVPSAGAPESEVATGCWTRFTQRIRRMFNYDRQNNKPIKIAKRALDTDPERTGRTMHFDWSRFALGRRGDGIMKTGAGSYGAVYSGIMIGNSAPTGDQDKQLSHQYVLKKGDHFEADAALKNLELIGEFGFTPADHDTVLVMRHRGEPVDYLVSSTNPLPANIAAGIMRPALAQIAALHQSNLIHGDIKPANILIDHTGQSRLVDVDDLRAPESCVDGKNIYRQRTKTLLCCGPESFGFRADVSDRVDIWGFGYSLACLIIGKYPGLMGDDESPYRFNKEKHHRFVTWLGNQTTIPSEAKEVILACMDLDQDKRPSARELLDNFALFREKDYSLMGAMELTNAHREQFECLKDAELALERGVNNLARADEMRALEARVSAAQATVKMLQTLLERQQKSSILGARMAYEWPGGDRGAPGRHSVVNGSIALRPNLIRSGGAAADLDDAPMTPSAQSHVAPSSDSEFEDTWL